MSHSSRGASSPFWEPLLYGDVTCSMYVIHCVQLNTGLFLLACKVLCTSVVLIKHFLVIYSALQIFFMVETLIDACSVTFN